jgi:ADP-ribosylglycohydrolase
MRVSPVGAYFADELGRAIEEARQSAEVTHMHPDGIAGALAIAVATAIVVQGRNNKPGEVRQQLWDAVLDVTPIGPTRRGIEKAARLPSDSHVDLAAGRLGTVDGVISSDTAPFCLWSAARWLEDYEEALWGTVAGLGDRDTTCAIVGGIVAAYRGRSAIPDRWRMEREALPIAPPSDGE